MSKPEGYAVVLNKEACIRCGRCFRACPVHAISIDDWPVIDPALCTACGHCIQICPTHALSAGSSS